MHTVAPIASPIVCISAELSAVSADLLVVPWFEEEAANALPGLDSASSGEVARALKTKEFQPKPYELFVTPLGGHDWKAERLMLIGAGKRAESNGDLVRKLAAAAGLSARYRRAERVAFAVRGPGDLNELAQAAAEGLTLSEFEGATYKTNEPAPAAIVSWTIVIEGGEASTAGANAATSRGRILGESSNLARALDNEPGNRLTPREFARIPKRD